MNNLIETTSEVNPCAEPNIPIFSAITILVGGFEPTPVEKYADRQNGLVHLPQGSGMKIPKKYRKTTP